MLIDNRTPDAPQRMDSRPDAGRGDSDPGTAREKERAAAWERRPARWQPPIDGGRTWHLTLLLPQPAEPSTGSTRRPSERARRPTDSGPHPSRDTSAWPT